MQDDIETDDDRKDFAKNLRLKLGFLYGTIMEDGKYKQPFQSELLVQVLVQHRCATLGAIDNHRKTTYAKGALSLATAVACIFALSSNHD